MSDKTTIRFSEEDKKKIELLKRIYNEKTTAKLIKKLIGWHYDFWERMSKGEIQ